MPSLSSHGSSSSGSCTRRRTRPTTSYATALHAQRALSTTDTPSVTRTPCAQTRGMWASMYATAWVLRYRVDRRWGRPGAARSWGVGRQRSARRLRPPPGPGARLSRRRATVRRPSEPRRTPSRFRLRRGTRRAAHRRCRVGDAGSRAGATASPTTARSSGSATSRLPRSAAPAMRSRRTARSSFARSSSSAAFCGSTSSSRCVARGE